MHFPRRLNHFLVTDFLSLCVCVLATTDTPDKCLVKDVHSQLQKRFLKSGKAVLHQKAWKWQKSFSKRECVSEGCGVRFYSSTHYSHHKKANELERECEVSSPLWKRVEPWLKVPRSPKFVIQCQWAFQAVFTAVHLQHIRHLTSTDTGSSQEKSPLD